MAAPLELTQEAVLRFLVEQGGRARNADLLEHFRGFLGSPDPQRRARSRERFKEMVNAVATVRQEPGSGAKYVQLRKKYRGGGGGSNSPGAHAREAAAGEAAAAEGAPGTAGPAAEPPRPPPESQAGGAGSSNRSGCRRDGDAAAETGAVAQPRNEASGTPAGEPPGPEPGHSAPSQCEAPSPGARQVPQPSQGSPEEGGGRTEEQEQRGRAAPCAEQQGAEAAEAEEQLCGDSGGGQRGELSPPPASTAASAALGGAPVPSTPRCGRRTFRERVLGSSPQTRRGGGGGGDSDSASLASSSAEDEGGGAGGAPVALDPLEHAWMLCASDGRWESLEGLLSCEPALLSRRDFITGFTCLHWAAKHGRHELLALLVNFAHRHRLPVDINARTSGGYTALHLAAVHGHLEVVKLLVGAYDADVDIRDYSGRKAAHYLGQGTAEEVRSLVGALQVEADSAAPNGSGRWRLSKVLPSTLITYKLSHLHHGEEGEPGEGVGAPGKGKELSRKISGSGRIKPRLNKIRFRTQIIHTTPSFRGDTEEEGQEEKSLKASFKLRPKSNVFG